MDIDALFRLSYGIYIITSHSGNQEGGCLVNTVFQVTAEPIRLGVSVAKANFTHQLIQEGSTMGISVLGQDANAKLLGRFGYRSGRDEDKFEKLNCHLDALGNRMLDEPGIIAHISCKVMEKTDLGTHTVFFCDVEDAACVQEGEAMTYQYFRDVKRLKASRHAPTYVKSETAG